MSKSILKQAWRVRMTKQGPIIDSDTHPEGDSVCMVYSPMSIGGERMTLAQSDAIRDERAAFIAAAPDMARALLDVTPIVDGVAHSPLCGIHGLGADKRCHYTCDDIRAALRKGGVIP